MMCKTGCTCSKAKLCPVSLGVGFGVAQGLFLLLFAWVGWFWGYGGTLAHDLSVIFHGYAPSLVGGLFGGLWGFIEGFVFGLIAGFVYDFCVCCGCKCKKSCVSDEDQ